MTQNGTPSFSMDDVLGGVLPGRIHLITGAPGTGKTSACLHFLKEAVRRRERAVFITRDRNADLRSHALWAGMSLGSLVRDGRLTVVRYRPRFREALAETASPAALIDELRMAQERAALQQLATSGTPLRIAIDPLTPFLPHAEPTGAALAALAEWLDESRATALLTWTGEMPYGRDRRLDSLLERAGAIVRLEHGTTAGYMAHIVRARHGIANSLPIAFDIVPGQGVVNRPRMPMVESRAPQIVHDSQVTAVLTKAFRDGSSDAGAPAA